MARAYEKVALPRHLFCHIPSARACTANCCAGKAASRRRELAALRRSVVTGKTTLYA